EVRLESLVRFSGARRSVAVGGSRGATFSRREQERAHVIQRRSVRWTSAENGPHSIVAILVYRYADYGANGRMVEAGADWALRAPGNARNRRSNRNRGGPVRRVLPNRHR